MPAYEADMAKFGALDAQVLGISVDHVPCLKAWAESLGNISYPLLSDFWPHGEVARKYGVLRAEGYSERAIFLVDKQGIIRYIDVHDINDQPQNEVLLAELRKLEPELAARLPGEAEVPAASPPAGGVVLYCTRWCGDCQRARIWLQEHGIKYTEVDVNANPAAARKVRQWAGGNLVTPTFDINGTIVLDFDVAKLTELLLK
jgi:glutaredoxin